MVDTLYTYFGDYLLGLFVEWSLDTDSDGYNLVKLTMTQNLRSKLHIYGYGSNTSGESLTATYVDGGTIPSDFDADTDTNQYESRNNKFIGYIGTGTTNTALDALPLDVYPDDADATTQTEIYHFYLAWQNPDATGAVTYDGMEVKAYANVTPP